MRVLLAGVCALLLAIVLQARPVEPGAAQTTGGSCPDVARLALPNIPLAGSPGVAGRRRLK